MLSKWQIWDFFSSVKPDHLEGASGVFVLNTFDFQSLKLIKDHLLKKISATVHHKLASEVTNEWIENEFMTLSFFSSSESFFIHQAQELNAELLEKLVQLELDNRFIILNFESETASFKKLVKEKSVRILQIEAPRFWETTKLLDFTAAFVRLPLSYDAKTWMLNSLENTFQQFYNSCCLLKLNYPSVTEVSLHQVKELLEVERLDSFYLANIFGKKNFKEFYTQLIELEGDFEKMRSFFLFMQSHLIKVADPSYLEAKDRLSQYDKGILQVSKLWKQEELLQWVGRFNDLEIMAKKKDSALWNELKFSYLRVFQ